MRRLVALLAGAALLLTGCGGASSAGADEAGARPLLVAAASDLLPAFTELGELYSEQTGRPVTFTFGSSGQLAQQLENGAPFELFASASVEYVEDVVAAGRADPTTQADYAYGRLAVWTPGPAADLAALAGAGYRRIALANPEHAPYGAAAEQALRHAGVLPGAQGRLVLGENVSDALRLATSGNADAAVVALSLVLARDGGSYSVVPAEAHAPLQQTLVVTAAGPRGAAAQAFADLVTSDGGRAVMRRNGFVLPGESVPGEG